jgi:hypothetical protein
LTIDVKCTCCADCLEELMARLFLPLLERPAVLPPAQPLMLEPFMLDGEAASLILDDPDWMKR